MFKEIIVQTVSEDQDSSNNEVYCPMCELAHDNDTWCQAYMVFQGGKR